MPSSQFYALVNDAKKLSKTTERVTIAAERHLQQITEVRNEIVAPSASFAKSEPQASSSAKTGLTEQVKTTGEVSVSTSTMRPKSSIMVALQRESEKVQRLQVENQVLKQQLLEHQVVYELILSCYRKKVLALFDALDRKPYNIIDSLEGPNRQTEKAKNVLLAGRFIELQEHYKELVAPIHEQAMLKQMEKISELEVERNGLVELCQISKNYGSFAPVDEDHEESRHGYFDLERRNSIVERFLADDKADDKSSDNTATTSK